MGRPIGTAPDFQMIVHSDERDLLVDLFFLAQARTLKYFLRQTDSSLGVPGEFAGHGEFQLREFDHAVAQHQLWPQIRADKLLVLACRIDAWHAVPESDEDFSSFVVFIGACVGVNLFSDLGRN